MLNEKFWINSCWNISGGLVLWSNPGNDHSCSTGGLTACLSLLVNCGWSNEIEDLSLDRLPARPPGSFGTRKFAIAPNVLGLWMLAISLFARVFPKTNYITSKMSVNSLHKVLIHKTKKWKECFNHTSICASVLGMSSISPTKYSVAFAGKYQRSWNFWIFSGSHFLICSSSPIGNLLLSLFSECKCCSNC